MDLNWSGPRVLTTYSEVGTMEPPKWLAFPSTGMRYPREHFRLSYGNQDWTRAFLARENDNHPGRQGNGKPNGFNQDFFSNPSIYSLNGTGNVPLDVKTSMSGTTSSSVFI